MGVSRRTSLSPNLGCPVMREALIRVVEGTGPRLGFLALGRPVRRSMN